MYRSHWLDRECLRGKKEFWKRIICEYNDISLTVIVNVQQKWIQ